MTATSIPQGHHAVEPYVIVADVEALLAFVAKTFDGTELRRMSAPNGTVLHVEVKVGDSVLMAGSRGPSLPQMISSVHVYVPDVDATYDRALKAGAHPVSPPTDHVYGDRSAGVRDGQGNFWWIGTHKEDVSDAEVARRLAAKAGAQ